MPAVYFARSEESGKLKLASIFPLSSARESGTRDSTLYKLEGFG